MLVYGVPQCLARPLATFGTVCRRSCLTAVLPMCLCCARVNDSLYRLNGSLWVERLTRCEHGGLAVGLEPFLVVSRVTGYFGRPLAVGVYMAESI